MGSHPRLTTIEYPFYSAYFLGPEKLTRVFLPEAVMPKAQLDVTRDENYQKAFDRLQDSMSAARAEGKTPIVKEHVFFFSKPKIVAANIPDDAVRTVIDRPMLLDKYNPTATVSIANPTILPDSFLKSVSPIILFRHPARVIPSYCRAVQRTGLLDVHDEEFPVGASLRWPTLLFDWYADRVTGRKNTLSIPGQENPKGAWPVLIEADDFIHEEHLIPNLCALLGLDPSEIKYEWDVAPQEKKQQQNPMLASFLSTMQNSTGIVKDQKRDSEMVLAEEKKGWIDEFGAEIADVIERYVDLAMVDYHYLRQYKL